jgi:hypothetical protein
MRPWRECVAAALPEMRTSGKAVMAEPLEFGARPRSVGRTAPRLVGSSLRVGFRSR